MIPPVVFDTTSSRAEQRVFQLLASSELGPSATTYHSLSLARHEYKMLGELDFVVLNTAGLLVLEVKGGGVERRGGVFVYTDRYGNEHRSSEGPFQQARSGMFSLRNRLIDRFSVSEVRQLTFGYAVVFPDCDFPYQSVEWDDEMVIDGRTLRGRQSLEAPLKSVMAYWNDKVGSNRRASVRLIERVGAMLRPEFDQVPSLRYAADRIEASMDSLTSDQYRILDAVEQAPRILCEGGAGTGKTFLAAETARRHASDGLDVVLVCRSPVLSAYLDTRLGRDGVSVVALSHLDEVHKPTDVLVVDEGQDLLSFDVLERLDRVLIGGLESGRWRFFYDVNNQSNLEGTYDSQALEFLESLGAVPLSLRQNCRNTPEVVTQTQLMTGADLGIPVAGHGPPVEFVYPDTPKAEAKALETWIASLAADDVPLSDITVLTGGNQDTGSAIDHLSPSLHNRLQIIAQFDGRSADGLTCGPIIEFKGLENRFVALVDITPPGADPFATGSLYVGLSRARVGLWVAIREPHRQSFEETMTTHLDAVAGAESA